MAIIGSFVKQPVDVFDYDIDFADFLTDGDALVSAVSTVSPAGLVVGNPIIEGTRAKVWVSSGTDKQTYKITVTATTANGRVKQDEFRVKIKDY